MKDITKKACETRPVPKIISIDEGEIRNHLDQMVKKSVEDTLNSLLDAEADALCKATRYERLSQLSRDTQIPAVNLHPLSRRCTHSFLNALG